MNDLVDEEVMDNLISEVDYPRFLKGKRYYLDDAVTIYRVSYNDSRNFTIYSRVSGHGLNVYNVTVQVKNAEIVNQSCECPDYTDNDNICKHIVATLFAFKNSKVYKDRILFNSATGSKESIEDNTMSLSKYRNDRKYQLTAELIDNFSNQNSDYTALQDSETVLQTKENTIKIVPYLEFNNYDQSFKLIFKLGEKQLYRLKDLVSFAENIKQEKTYKYGAKLCFKHSINMFTLEAQRYIPYILKYASVIDYANDAASSSYSYIRNFDSSSITLNKNNFDEFFDMNIDQKIYINFDVYYFHSSPSYTFLNQNPNIQFKIKKENTDDYKIVSNIDRRYISYSTDKYIYMFIDGIAYRCLRAKEKATFEVLDKVENNDIKALPLKKEMLPMFFSYVAPKISKNLNIDEIKDIDVEKYVPKPLHVKIYLDYDKFQNIIANVKFCYQDLEFNPFVENTNINVARNIAEEKAVIQKLRLSKFELDTNTNTLVMQDEDAMYDFLQNQIDDYTENYEVLVSDSFKNKQIKQPKIGSLGVKVENNLLQIDLNNLDFDVSELKDIMKKYSLKKKYHRLKDGSFVNLDSNDDINFIDNLTDGMDIDYKTLSKGVIRVPVYRTMYLEKLLDNFKNTEIQKNDKYKAMINKTLDKEDDENIKVPENFQKVLRNYQKTGYKWLKVLDDYRFGGILADDMGLGKTIQVISVIVSYINEQKDKRKTNLVVCPSSLVLNWQNEFIKFAPSIKTLAISGKAEERKSLIENLENYDVVFTSYDLLKRDIDQYIALDYTFKYVIADEAQYIKNSNTQNATAIKSIKADTRFALTGTPIENSLSELWSIFDYIMPGYLFSYTKFKKNYEMAIVKNQDQTKLKKLKMLIEPFILRRIKKEVLTELPDKTITVLDNEMTDEQKKIYLAYLAQAKVEAKAEIENNGFEKSQIKILALLTRLRQICCHPSLFIENYKGESSKLNQCIEVVKDAISSGHKILLFSQFTSMLDIIENELKKEDIGYYKLVGSTKVNERVQLVDDFNTKDDAKIFLISLKAGGTGLNLTGADVVIHYDPWWNISAENQATDRTYRIGQKKNVQVYKLITKNSIEEKISDLQEKKAKLIDNMLSTQQTFINKLSRDDIMALFE